jgi:ABC-type sugar transport system permease subunit
MKTITFARFVAPSVLLMLALMAAPLIVTFYLSVRNCVPFWQQRKHHAAREVGWQWQANHLVQVCWL